MYTYCCPPLNLGKMKSFVAALVLALALGAEAFRPAMMPRATRPARRVFAPIPLELGGGSGEPPSGVGLFPGLNPTESKYLLGAVGGGGAAALFFLSQLVGGGVEMPAAPNAPSVS